MTRRAGIRERLLAYIHPNRAETAAQAEALSAAVGYQAAWEAENGDSLEAARRGVQRFSAGDYSETYFDRGGGAGGPALCPDARAALYNAGLLRRGLPCAKRL